MILRFENTATNSFWSAELVDVELTIRAGSIGTDGEAEVIEDSFEVADMPPLALIERRILQLPHGYREVLPEELRALVEEGHGIQLRGRLRRFYDQHEYKQHQGKRCAGLECRVHFASPEVQGEFSERYYDPRQKVNVHLIPIASKVSESGGRDEQQWIGVNAALADGPVYALYTSGAFEEAYPNLDAFLAELE